LYDEVKDYSTSTRPVDDINDDDSERVSELTLAVVGSWMHKNRDRDRSDHLSCGTSHICSKTYLEDSAWRLQYEPDITNGGIPAIKSGHDVTKEHVTPASQETD